MQGRANQGTSIVHDGEEVSSGDVPYCRVYTSLCSRPRYVDLMLNTTRRPLTVRSRIGNRMYGINVTILILRSIGIEHIDIFW